MHGEIDRARQQGLLDLLGKQALAALLRERAVDDLVAGGLDDRELDSILGEAVRGSEPPPHLARLRKRQRRAARADADLRCLQVVLSEC